MGASFKVAQIVRSATEGDYTAYLKIGFKVASTTTALFGQGNYTLTPAPGALALLGLAGIVSRRRR
ncbi:MAG: hypothetical protein EXS00_08980 [Phycisphaerales bacterium]|nr:hypothetical protein [Phycisphaerales bacterium]